MGPASVVCPLEGSIFVGTQLTSHTGCSLLRFTLSAEPRTGGHLHDAIAGLMHGDVAAVSVAVHQWVFRPASLVRANTATTDHLLHIIRRQLVVRRQTTLAGDHLRRKRTCGGIRRKYEPKLSPQTPLFPPRSRFRSRSVEISCFKRIYVPFRHCIFSPKHSQSHC